jgi:EmrB/QacA subfamily drug resistance transporter
MVFIDGTVVNVALPALQTSLNANVLDVQWVVESYSLLFASLLLVGGSLGDHYGRRRIFVLGLAIFASASLWCGLSANIGQLIAARAVQGFGAALLVPGSLAIISTSFRAEERGRAIGTWSAFSAITAAIGPVFGGWLIEHISWRAIFFLNLPLALCVVFISLRHVPESREAEKGSLDLRGAILTVLGLGSLVYGLIESSRLGFSASSVFTSLCAGIFFLSAFLFVEARVHNPMLPLALFRSSDFSGANLLTFFLYSAIGGTLFFLPLNLIQIHGYTSTAAGAALLPFILIIFVLSRWAGGLVHGYGAKVPLVVGPIIVAVGLVLCVLPNTNGNYWSAFFPAVIVLGLGMAVSVAPLTTTVMNSVPQDRVGTASGINNAIARTGGLLAIAVLGIVIVHTFNRELDQRVARFELSREMTQMMDANRTKLAGFTLPEEIEPALRASLKQSIDDSFVVGFRQIMLIGAALTLVSALSAAVFITGKSKTEL